MEILKRYKTVIIIIIPILILVLIRQFGVIHFKSDAEKWAELSTNHTNIVTANQIDSLPDKKLIINLDNKDMEINVHSAGIIQIPADSILCNQYLSIIEKHRGPLLLYSNEAISSARIWMILSQMGMTNIFILVNNKDPEVFKHEFRPDTLTRPELFQ
jgi:hypothetical protein